MLHGFNNFSLRLRWLDPNEPLGIGFLATEAAIEIEADQPVVLLESLGTRNEKHVQTMR